MRIVLICAVLAQAAALQAQIGGDAVYQFLRLSSSARATALGGSLIATKDDDVALSLANPALLNATMDKQISFNQTIHPAGATFGYLSYGQNFDKIGTFQAGVQYINYGKFQQTEPDGSITGEFSARELALNVGGSRALSDRLTVGANLKFVQSQLASYKSVGLAGDVAAIYEDTAARFVAALTFRNFGSQLTTYNKDKNFEPLPFEIQFGISKRLKYLPLRFSVIGQQLQRWAIAYDDPAIRDRNQLFNDTVTTRPGFGVFVDNFFRHLIFNAELSLGKKEVLRLRLGYNYLHSAEMRVQGLRGLAGFSTGFGIKISKFRIDYGLNIMHFAGMVHHFTFSTNLNSFLKKKSA